MEIQCNERTVNDPTNWVGDAVPSNGVYGAFTVAGNYTVTFPSQGLEEISATCVSPSFSTGVRRLGQFRYHGHVVAQKGLQPIGQSYTDLPHGWRSYLQH